jgi:hypothetical protein
MFWHHSDGGRIAVETIEIFLFFSHENIKDNVMKCINMCWDMSGNVLLS